MDWSSWVQEIGKAAVEVYGAKQERDYNVAQLQLQQQTAAEIAAAEKFRALQQAGGGIAGVSPTVLLIGAAVLVGVMVLQKD